MNKYEHQCIHCIHRWIASHFMTFTFIDHLKDMWLSSRFEMCSINRKCSVCKSPPPIFICLQNFILAENPVVSTPPPLSKVPGQTTVLFHLISSWDTHEYIGLAYSTWWGVTNRSRVVSRATTWKVFIQHGWWFSCSSISGVSFTKLSPGCVTSLPPLNLFVIRAELHTIGFEKWVDIQVSFH